MKKISLTIFACLSLTWVHGDDLTTNDGKTYEEYTVVSHDDNGISIWYKDGQATIPFGNLPADLQKEYGYADKVAELETDYQASLAAAKDQKKLVLLNFTGSDWCPYCQALDKEALDTPAFKSFANENFLCVTVDFPNGKELPSKVANQNHDLKEQFQITTFPTLIVVDTDGKELGRSTGYNPGSGPQAVISDLKPFLGKTPPAGSN
jgi:thioredoxin-related protein